jgi:acyl-coenzyme A synthetase/AMP-(fatty) acid ligase/acyl carrier protein
MLEDSGSRVLVADKQNFDVAKELASNRIRLLNIDDVDTGLSEENLELSVSPDSAARIIYTSGSTGRPKGVTLSHRRILHEVMTNINGCRVGFNDRLSLLTTPSTSQGTVVTYTALLSGAALYLFDLRKQGFGSLAAWLTKEEITVYTSVRAVFRRFASALPGSQNLPHLRLIALGGDQVRKGDVELYKKRFSDNCILKIFLSSTESGNICQYAIDKQTEITSEIVPVGYPSDGVEILLLDEKGQKVGLNEIGEIAVRSRYLSLGYWRSPELTAAKFRSDPDDVEKRIYLTGDLGRRLLDGCLEYLGRKDFRVKVRGYGVETGEIESALLKNDSVREAVVVAADGPDSDARLVAYVVPVKRPAPGTNELRGFLRDKLPEYMVPADIVVLDELPLTPMGKIDRQSLPPPDLSQPDSVGKLVAPQNPTEVQIAKIWCDVLRVEQVGIHDDFFDLGGNSLTAIEVISRVREFFNVDLLFAVMLAKPTVAGMAAMVLQHQAGEVGDAELGDALKELEQLSEEEAQHLLVEATRTGKV